VGQAGGVLLVEALRRSGLDQGLSAGLARWRKPTAIHDPAKIICDLAVSLAVGGDCLADVGVLRSEPGVYGHVASDPTVSRTITALATDLPRVLAALDAARAHARRRVWQLAGEHAPDHRADTSRPVIIDLDATLVTSYSDKESARPTYKRGYGFHPLCAFLDHGETGTGEPLQIMLRPGNAGSNTIADHIATTRDALKQLPSHRPGVRPGRAVLVRCGTAGGTHGFLEWLSGQRMLYSVGFTLPFDTATILARIPDQVWTPVYDADGQVRDGAWVAELTGLLDLSGWPKGMRVICRKERPHPGAQLPLTRRRRPAHHRVRHQHRHRSAPRSRAAAPTPGPCPRTASGWPRTPDCRTCPYTASRRIRSGAWSSRSPPNSPPGCRCSPSPATKPKGGSRNGSVSGCSPSPPCWPVPDGG
jgi:Transposase DDE domain group 1